jgi:hypothetical protein
VPESLQCFDFRKVEGREPDGVVEEDGDGEGVAGGPFGPGCISLAQLRAISALVSQSVA